MRWRTDVPQSGGCIVVEVVAVTSVTAAVAVCLHDNLPSQSLLSTLQHPHPSTGRGRKKNGVCMPTHRMDVVADFPQHFYLYIR